MKYFEEMKENLDWQVDDFLGDHDFFEVALFLSFTPLFQKEVIRTIFYRTNNNSTIGLSEWNLDEVIKFIWGPNNKTIKEIKDMKLRKDWNKVFF